MICAPRHRLPGESSRRERRGLSIWHVSDIRERHVGFWCKRLKEGDRLEDLCVIEC